MLNKTIIQGRMVRDPVLRDTADHTPVVSFTLAVERDYKDRSTGEKGADFIDCVAWNRTAEFVAHYFTKGRMAIVDGRLQIRRWEDNEGNKRSAPEIVANNVYFGDSKRDAEEPAPPKQDPLDDLQDRFRGIVGGDEGVPF